MTHRRAPARRTGRRRPLRAGHRPRAGRLGLLQPAGRWSWRPAARTRFATGDSEWIVLPLSGGCTVRTADGETFELAGPGKRVQRRSRDFAYVPRDAQSTIASGAGGRFALTGARASADSPPATAPRRRSPSSCAAPATARARSTTSARPDVFDVRPAHRRRGDHPRRQLVLVPAAQARRAPARRGVASWRRSTTSRSPTATARPASATSASPPPGRAATPTCSPRSAPATPSSIPDGWHGPSMAAPGHDMYYLNVMAGPGGARVADLRPPRPRLDPRTWPEQPVDPRLPLYTHRPRRRRPDEHHADAAV